MNHIDQLIAQHCPNGVEHKKLGEIAYTVTGLSGKTKKDFSDGNARFVSYKNIFSNLSVNQQLNDFVKVSPNERQNILQLGDVLFTGSSESFDEVGMSCVVTTTPEEPLYLNSFCFAIRFLDDKIFDPEFSKYLFRSDFIRKRIILSANGVTRINISKSRFMKIKVPVPPLVVQQEIVKILDTFTALESELERELEAELEARKKQYKHYRESLFKKSISEGVELYKLGDIAEFKYGQTTKASNTGSHRFIRITDINPNGKLSSDNPKYVDADEATSEYIVREGDLLMARTGATFGKTMLVDQYVSGVYASFLIRIRFLENKILPEYYWHFAQSNLYWDQANWLVSLGSQPQFNANVLRLVEVPVPPLEEQRRIVGILDKFDALVNDLSAGLPAEIKARRQQYEYYRDKLLTFKELPA